MPKIEEFLEIVKESLTSNSFIKLTFSNKIKREEELQNIFCKRVLIKKVEMISCVYRYATKDVTKNYTSYEFENICINTLTQYFTNASLFTTSAEYHLVLTKKNNQKIKTIYSGSNKAAVLHSHNREKNRLIKAEAKYLHELGVTTAEGKVKNDMQDKFRQINKYIEIIDGIIKNHSFKNKISIIDMGCGKGYLTFSLYDYLSKNVDIKVEVAGIEIRKELVDKCNAIAKVNQFEGLHFIEGNIASTPITDADILIALHACDTATDDAIYKGIKTNIPIIIVAPCCHKQIRKQLKPSNILNEITEYGILLERQSEIVTDTIRSLILQSNGYKTKIFDFISTEHTPKNVMITGIKKNNFIKPDNVFLSKVAELKKTFGINNHYLETLLLN